MICARHDWWGTEACPKCDPYAAIAAAVTAPETNAPDAPPAALEAETISQPDLVSGHPSEDALAIPDFLLRNKDGTFAHPELMVHAHAATVQRSDQAPVRPEDARPVSAWSDAELLAAVDGNDNRTLIERQPIYQELRAREDKKKSHTRIAEMKAKKAAKET